MEDLGAELVKELAFHPADYGKPVCVYKQKSDKINIVTNDGKGNNIPF